MLFNIFHLYDVDGGFGDAIYNSELLGVAEFASQEAADAWCKYHDCKHVYDRPYAELECGILTAKPIEVKPTKDILPSDWGMDMWCVGEDYEED